jgi:inorganic pyrophosphatase
MDPACNAYGTCFPPRCFLEAHCTGGAEPIGQRLQFTGKNAGACDRPVTRKVNSGFVPILLILFNYSKNVMSFDKVSPGKNVPDAFNVPQTLSGDGDPVDVLVIAPYPLLPGVVVPCRPLGILMMEDEAGVDGKVLAVPTDKVLPIYSHWKSVDDVNPMRLKAISHFFEHYKDLEAGKWVKVVGWEGIESAKKEVLDGIAAYKK